MKRLSTWLKRAAVPGSPDTPARKEALEGCKSAK
jgi:hypothetical protein